VLAGGPRTVASGPHLSKFTTLAQTFSSVTDYMSNKKCEKEDKQFWMSSEIISFLMKKLDMYSKMRTYG